MPTPTTLHWSDSIASGPYRWTMLGAILVSAVFWYLKSRRDPAMLPVYIGALGGAFLGAKLAYLFAEGWRDWPMPDRWLRLANGKSVLGGILGGYGGVELMKWLVGYRKFTGDLFALIAPLGIALGRIGCLLQGCCLGKPTASNVFAARDAFGVMRWPAVQIELAFQIAIFAVVTTLRNHPRFTNRLFFLYMAAYGVFRSFHEWMRETPPLFARITGYQILSVAMTVLGVTMFLRRGRRLQSRWIGGPLDG